MHSKHIVLSPIARTHLTDLNVLFICSQSMSTGWPGNIEEIDITQTLPGVLLDYEQSINLSHIPRQSLHTTNIWIQHPPEFTDGFTLHVKAALILARIAKFNSRLKYFEARHVGEAEGGSASWNATKSPEFLDLEEAIRSFRSSFPHEFRDYMKPRSAKSGLDPNLYAAHIIPAV